MGRIRSIKPEFPQSESIGKLSRDARLLFIQLWTIADDAGRTRASSRMLASLLYPFDELSPNLVETWLQELNATGHIRIYEVNGNHYLYITNWLIHQKIDRPTPSKLPPFSGTPVTEVPSPRRALDEPSLNDRQTLDEASATDRKGKERKGSGGETERKGAARNYSARAATDSSFGSTSERDPRPPGLLATALVDSALARPAVAAQEPSQSEARKRLTEEERQAHVARVLGRALKRFPDSPTSEAPFIRAEAGKPNGWEWEAAAELDDLMYGGARRKRLAEEARNGPQSPTVGQPCAKTVSKLVDSPA
jgi:hypothetical protein